MDRPQKCSNDFASKAVLYQGLARFCRQRIPFMKCFTTCQTWVKKIENTSSLPLFRNVALSIQIFLTTLSAPWQKQAFGIFNRYERISKQTFHAINLQKIIKYAVAAGGFRCGRWRVPLPRMSTTHWPSPRHLSSHMFVRRFFQRPLCKPQNWGLKTATNLEPHRRTPR